MDEIGGWDFDQVVSKWSPLAQSWVVEKMMSGWVWGFLFYSINREEAKWLQLMATSDGNGTSLWVGVSVPRELSL